MKVNNITTTTIYLTEEERGVLRMADDILYNIEKQVTEYLGTNSTIESMTTGEVISINEIPRTRGIIGGFSENTFWQKIKNRVDI